MNWAVIFQWLGTAGVALIVSFAVTIPKGRAEARHTDVEANVKLTESNLKGAQDAAARSEADRKRAEEARDQCRDSLNKALDLNDKVLDVIENFLDKLEASQVDHEDYRDMRVTIRTVRREVRKLRP